MDFQKSLLSRIREVFLLGSFNDTRVVCKDGVRYVPAFLLRSLSPVFRQDNSWTSVLFPDSTLVDLERFLEKLLVPYSVLNERNSVFNLLLGFNQPSRNSSHKTELKRSSTTAMYDLRAIRSEGIMEEINNESRENALNDEASTGENIKSSLFKGDEESSFDEDDGDEDYSTLEVESEGEDDDLYEQHGASSSFVHESQTSESDDLTHVTIKLNETGQIQMIHRAFDPPMSPREEEEFLSQTLRSELFSSNQSLLKCSNCSEYFDSLYSLRFHSAKEHGESSFFQLHLGHPHSHCQGCASLFTSYRSLIRKNKDIVLKDVVFACPHCRRRFMGRINALRVHLRDEHMTDISRSSMQEPHQPSVFLRGSKESLFCEFCRTQFHTTRLLNHHLSTHCPSKKESSSLPCRKCGKTFSQLRNLICHSRKRHGGKVYLDMSKAVFCPHCPAASNSKEGLARHIKRHHPSTPLETIHPGCKPCELLTQRLNTFQEQHSKDLIFKCPHCRMLFGSHHNGPLLYIMHHVFKFHRESLILETEESVESIIYVSGKGEAFRCDVCSTAFRSRPAFNQHILGCNGGKRKYTCEECGLSSGSLKALRAHLGADHDKKHEVSLGRLRNQGHKTSKVKCTDCRQEFKHEEDMRAHSLIHSGIVRCPIHGIVFKSESEVLAHVNGGGDGDLRCCMCGKRFPYISIFMSHLRRHLKLSPYTCSLCQKGVRSLANLRGHMRTMHASDHPEEEALFRCEHCFKGFTTKGHLKEHISGVHERYNNVHCPVCHKSFNTQKRMKKHLFSSHKDMADQFRSHSRVQVYEQKDTQ